MASHFTSSVSPMDRAVDRARDFERRGDAFNALEWWVVALRYAPGDPLLKARADAARAEVDRTRREGAYTNPRLTAADRDAIARCLRLAEAYTANGTLRLAHAQVRQALRIDPQHPLVRRAASALAAAMANAPADEAAMTARVTRRLAVAASLPPARAADVLRELRSQVEEAGFPALLPRIDKAINQLSPQQ